MSTGISAGTCRPTIARSEEHTSELQSRLHLVCRLLLEKKKTTQNHELPRKPRCRQLVLSDPDSRQPHELPIPPTCRARRYVHIPSRKSAFHIHSLLNHR